MGPVSPFFSFWPALLGRPHPLANKPCIICCEQVTFNTQICYSNHSLFLAAFFPPTNPLFVPAILYIPQDPVAEEECGCRQPRSDEDHKFRAFLRCRRLCFLTAPAPRELACGHNGAFLVSFSAAS